MGTSPWLHITDSLTKFNHHCHSKYINFYLNFLETFHCKLATKSGFTRVCYWSGTGNGWTQTTRVDVTVEGLAKNKLVFRRFSRILSPATTPILPFLTCSLALKFLKFYAINVSCWKHSSELSWIPFILKETSNAFSGNLNIQVLLAKAPRLSSFIYIQLINL